VNHKFENEINSIFEVSRIGNILWTWIVSANKNFTHILLRFVSSLFIVYFEVTH